MSDSIDKAAMAFDTAIGNRAPSKSTESEDTGGGAPEPLFSNLGDLEVDENSPARGGGDNLPFRGEKKKKQDDEEDEFTNLAAEGEDGEEDDDNSDDGEDEGKEDDEKEDDADEPSYEVLVDGERVEVKLSEALKGYQRQEVFHRRLNLLENAKSAIRKEAEAVLSDRKKYIELIDDLQTHIDMVVPKEPDWDEEYKKDPVAARNLQKRFDELKVQKSQLKAAQDKARKEAAEQEAAASEEYAKIEATKVLRNNPQWKDKEVMKRDARAMKATATAAGFSDEEYGSISDSRMVTVLLKAAKYDRIMANKPKPVRQGGKPIDPGAGRNVRTAPKGVNKALQTLSRTGSVEAAGEVFTQILNRR